MTEAAVRTDIHETLDVHLHLAPHCSFGLVIRLDDGADFRHFVIVQLADLLVDVDAGLCEDLLRGRPSDSVNIRQANH